MKGDGYRYALELAWKGLTCRGLEEAARNAPAHLDDGRLTLSFLGREAVVDARSRTVSVGGKGAATMETMLVLHYLAGVGAAVPSSEWTSFLQLPGGHAYYGAFKRRIIDEVACLFQHRPGSLLAAAMRLGGKRLSMGDASVRLDVFPKVPVAVVVWAGDDEMDGSANVLFDRSAPLHLPVEDLAEIGTLVLDMLSRAVEALSN